MEIGLGIPGSVPLRDSKSTGGPVLVFRTGAFYIFLSGVKRPLS
ncbi:DUF397 domain-containing protein [Streptomyces sp. NPDC088124]